MSRLILVVFVVGIFAGCSIKDVSKPIVKYTIYDNAVVAKELKSVNKILKIEEFKSPKYIQDKNIWYKKPSYETRPYIYSVWNEEFLDLIEQNVENSIYSSSLFKSVFSKHSKIRADIVLESEVIEAKQFIYKDSTAKVSFIMRSYLVDSKSLKLIDSKEFKYEEKCLNVDAKSAVLAYNNIIKNLNKDVVLWLKTLVKEN
jgi:ABC-type uncharacterized transport system auxiliary subunit